MQLFTVVSVRLWNFKDGGPKINIPPRKNLKKKSCEECRMSVCQNLGVILESNVVQN